MLFNQIITNKSLKFVDAKTEKYFKIKDIFFDLNILKNKNKQLVFLYCNKNNKVHSIGIYLSLIKNNFAIVLLNEDLNEELKYKLEEDYSPDIIIDEQRSELRNFLSLIVKSKSFDITIFKSKKERKIILDPMIKLLLSTSGTTGSPKLVKLSEKNLYHNAISIINYLPIQSNDITPLNLPIFYSYGLSVLNSNAIAGGEIVCNCEDILDKTFWKQFRDLKFTSLSGVPFVYEMLDRIGFRKNRYPTLRYITQAGGNLNEKIKQNFFNYCLDNSIDFYVMYGQTEATARISYVPPEKLKYKLKSIGIPILNGKLFIDKITNELLYEGPNVFGGYALNNHDLRFWDNKSHLRTGDLARQDSSGYFFIEGRLKRIVKVFGSRVNLDELESFLKFNFEGINFACFSINDKKIVIYNDKKTIPFQIIKKIISSKLKIHSSFIKLNFIDHFPLTSNGKINYKELQKKYEL